MGFLNPFIYKHPSGFQDVTCGINKATRNYGFTAVEGWDAASGYGTPDFEALSKLAVDAGSKSKAEIVV
jgi:tripeptidyl-peptidase-1